MCHILNADLHSSVICVRILYSIRRALFMDIADPLFAIPYARFLSISNSPIHLHCVYILYFPHEVYDVNICHKTDTYMGLDLFIGSLRTASKPNRPLRSQTTPDRFTQKCNAGGASTFDIGVHKVKCHCKYLATISVCGFISMPINTRIK